MDVDELFVSNGRRFDITTVLMLGLRIVGIKTVPLVVDCFFFLGWKHILALPI